MKKTVLLTLKEMHCLSLMARHGNCTDEEVRDLEMVNGHSPNRKLVKLIMRRLQYWLRWLAENNGLSRQNVTWTTSRLLNDLSQRMNQYRKRLKKGGDLYQADILAEGLIKWAYAVKTKPWMRKLQKDSELSPR